MAAPFPDLSFASHPSVLSARLRLALSGQAAGQIQRHGRPGSDSGGEQSRNAPPCEAHHHPLAHAAAQQHLHPIQGMSRVGRARLEDLLHRQFRQGPVDDPANHSGMPAASDRKKSSRRLLSFFLRLLPQQRRPRRENRPTHLRRPGLVEDGGHCIIFFTLGQGHLFHYGEQP